jgi:NAD+ synthase (glutamine-hydrolysing)
LPVVEVSEAPVAPTSPEERRRPGIGAALPPTREVYEALVLGTRDYVRKNGFTDVVIGLSGGIDSSLVAVVATDALGPQHVHGVLMPSRFSSDHSLTDAEKLCAELGIEHRVIAIEPAHDALLQMLAPSFGGLEPDISEENLQSRIRGVVLMALSNKFKGWMVLTTGNKSEMAVGYSTLYGDTAGGFAVIKDVPKMLVYELARERNARAGRALVPERVLSKPPSAELRPDQRDDESLPPYEVLDPIIEAYVEDDRTRVELVDLGFDPELVERVTRLVDTAEYKRRQSPPGVRVTPKAFGKDRRLPITNSYRG